MNAKRAVVFFLLTSFCSAPVFAKGVGAHDPAEIQMLMSALLYEIEEAVGLEHKASVAIDELDEEGRQILFDSVADKEKFSQDVHAAMQRIQSAKAMSPEPSSGISEVSTLKLAGSMPYTPDYPPTDNVSYEVARTFGLTSSPDQRCSGSGLETYRTVALTAKETIDRADAACELAGCDPIVVFCLSICGAVESVKLAIYVANIPLDACEAHDANVNAAEIEAGFENTVSILKDLGAHATDLDNHDQNLMNHDTRLVNHDDHLTTHDTDVKAMLTGVLGNQKEIIKLLKTPPGRRPGWKKEGYRNKRGK